MRLSFSRGFMLGAGTAALAYMLRRPIKKAAVIATGGLFHIGERSREMLHSLREEFEDIVAEAGYEHTKDHNGAVGSEETSAKMPN